MFTSIAKLTTYTLDEIKKKGGLLPALRLVVLRLQQYGLGYFLSVLQSQHHTFSSANKRYASWIAEYETSTLTPFDADFVAQRPVVISVVMPVYNTAEGYLRAAIDSVLAQTYPHWELCIADDASTAEHVRPTLAAYAAQYPRIKAMFCKDSNGLV